MIVSMLQNIGEFSTRIGDWDVPLGDLEAALADEWDPADRMWLLLASSAFPGLRGVDIADRLAEISQMATDANDVQFAANVAMLTAQTEFARGDLVEARALAHRAGELASALAPITLARAARMAIWSDDAQGARDDLQALDESGAHGPAIEADRLTIGAGIAALEGRGSDALAQYREALRGWRDLGLAWDEGLCGLDMALLLDPADPEVRAAAQTAREILVRLEAAPFIDRLDAALGGSGPGVTRSIVAGDVPAAAR
jgi:hypothetical protein